MTICISQVVSAFPSFNQRDASTHSADLHYLTYANNMVVPCKQLTYLALAESSEAMLMPPLQMLADGLRIHFLLVLLVGSLSSSMIGTAGASLPW